MDKLPKAVILGLEGDSVQAFAVVETVVQAKRAVLEFHADGLVIQLTSVQKTREFIREHNQ